ncbi:hypothetical protein [Streptomyces sp. NPDC059092]|uniref:hypothetical protein n=1 Tax=Streptomyces sp. NPDC059092 TaxID=3346725 RepID=UPI0036915A4A
MYPGLKKHYMTPAAAVAAAGVAVAVLSASTAGASTAAQSARAAAVAATAGTPKVTVKPVPPTDRNPKLREIATST